MKTYCICYTKKIEIRDNVGLTMRGRNVKSPENTICAKNVKSTRKINNLKMHCIYYIKIN